MHITGNISLCPNNTADMVPVGSICVLVVCVLEIDAYSPPISPEPGVCQETDNSSYGLHWPSTSTQTSSQPLCVNQAKELSIRTCTDGSWGPEPDCATIQEAIPACPENFTHIQDVCYIFTPKSTFPPQCPFPSVLPFDDYVDLFAGRNEEPVWMPITRDSSNGGLMVWSEASDLYRSEYSGSYSYDGTIKGKNCMVFTKNREAKAVSCNDEYPGVCAYLNLNITDNPICDSLGPCIQSDYDSKTKCFCSERGMISGPKAEFVQPYQNNLGWISSVYNFGLVKSPDGKYLWANSNQEISYTYWLSTATFDQNSSQVISTPDGWMLSEISVTGTLTMIEVPEPETDLQLVFDNSTKEFNLVMNNSLWFQQFAPYSTFCFTDAYSNLLYRYPRLDVHEGPTSSEFQFDLRGTFSGNYWCEAFRVSDSAVVRSETLFHNSYTFEFVGMFTMKRPPIDGDPLSSKIIPYVNEYILNKIYKTSDGTLYFSRIMDIIDLDEANNLIFVNIHFRSMIDIAEASISEKESRYHDLEDTIHEVLSLDPSHHVELLDLFSTDFCIGGFFNHGGVNLTWPTTLAHDEARPEEFCFRADGNLIKNLCDGSFKEGFSWSLDVIGCYILPQGNLSKHLITYFNQWMLPDAAIDDILGLENTQFNALDIFLTVEIFRRYFGIPINLDLLGPSLSKILKLNPWAILQSQLKACSTDKILDLINFVLKSNETSSFEMIQEDFVALSAPHSNLTGLVKTSSNGLRNITRLQDHRSAQQLIDEIPNLDFAISLSPTLMDKSDNEVQIGLVLFLNDTLFPQFGSTSGNVTAVFGMVPRSTNASSDVLSEAVSIIYRTRPRDKRVPSCVTWIFRVNGLQGRWMEDGTYYNRSSFHVCTFWQSGYYAIAFNSDQQYNLTADLQGLLDETVVDPNRLSKLARISEKYGDFNYVDVSLLGRVLDLVQNQTDNDLLYLGKIIDNMHRIPKTILLQSQEKHKATDLILYNIDNIIRNKYQDETEVLIVKEHFIIFVTNVQATNFTGLVLLESNQSVHVETLRGDDDITTIQSYSSSILLSPELKNQIPGDSKIIITIFFSDVLFNQNVTTNRSVSRIFGVVIPHIGNYTGPLTMLHNISSSMVSQCAHWNYSTKGQFESYWKSEGHASHSFVSRCDFWHTTHFTLLLYNNDNYTEYDVLDWFTAINSAISLTSLLCIVLTGILFEKWRRNIGNQILLNFSLAIILQIVTFYIADTMNRHSDSKYCTLIGVLLHYSVISQFCWMLTIAFLQFKRFVVVFAASPRYLLVKACICGWVSPLLPVMLALVLNNEQYVMSKSGLCYPSGLGLYLGVWLPLGIIGLINLIIFAYVMYSVFHTNTDSVAHTAKNAGMHQWRLFVLLFFMLGLTWCFGFLSGFDFGIVFAYMFCFTATLQGFVLFLYFIVFNANTRRLYVQSVKNLYLNLCLKGRN